MKKLGLLLALLMSLGMLAFADSPAGDPTGEHLGGVQDIPRALSTSAKPTLDDLASALGHTRIALNIVWTLMAGFLVMFMQAGFAMVETGFCRAKNAAHTFFMNFAVYFLGMTGYWLTGF